MRVQADHSTGELLLQGVDDARVKIDLRPGVTLVELREVSDVLGPYRAVLEQLARWAGDGLDVCGGDVQDLMEKHGLMVRVPADERFRQEHGVDEMLALKWKLPQGD